MNRQSYTVIFVSSMIVMISLGLRQTSGLFIHPVTVELGIGREAFGFAVALQNLLLGLPLAGYLADRFQPKWVIMTGGLVYVISLWLMSYADSTGAIWFSLGILTGLAQSATTYAVVLSAVSRVVPVHRRSTAFGIITAASSFGLFFMVWLSGQLLIMNDWRIVFEYLSMVSFLLVLFAAFIPLFSEENSNDQHPSFTALVSAVKSHRSYWLLTLGFFVCGFHVAFIANHLPAYITDQGISKQVAYTTLSLVGLFNIFGSVIAGWLGDRYSKKNLLSILYFSRAIIIGLFVFIPVNPQTAVIFGCIIGLFWLATVPLTSGLVGKFFNGQYMGMLYGIVFLGHQLGAFTGAWLGGRVFDLTGSYTSVWWGAVILSLIAACLHWFINEESHDLKLQANAG